VNLGESVLRALFSYWEEGRRALDAKQKHEPRSQLTPSQQQLNLSQNQLQNQSQTPNQSATSNQLQPNGYHESDKRSSDANSLKEDSGTTPNHSSNLDKSHLHPASLSSSTTPSNPTLNNSTNLTHSSNLSTSNHLTPSTSLLKGSANGVTGPPASSTVSLNEERSAQVCEMRGLEGG
jgi:hypothetical protein